MNNNTLIAILAGLICLIIILFRASNDEMQIRKMKHELDLAKNQTERLEKSADCMIRNLQND